MTISPIIIFVCNSYVLILSRNHVAKEMIPNIEGAHYRLTKEQWKSLCNEKFVRGIPCYVLFNKDGSVAFSNLSEGGYPGNDLMKPEIEKALKKK